MLLSTASRFSFKKCSFRWCRVHAALPLPSGSVGCKNITWQFGRILVITLLSCKKSSRISCDVLETKSFVPTCKIMTSGFFKIAIMWWLISTNIEPIKSCTFTKQFLRSFFSSIPVIIEFSAITPVSAGRVCLFSLGEESLNVQFLSETSLLAAFWKRSNCWHLSVVSYPFVYFWWAYGNVGSPLYHELFAV